MSSPKGSPVPMRARSSTSVVSPRGARAGTSSPGAASPRNSYATLSQTLRSGLNLGGGGPTAAEAATEAECCELGFVELLRIDNIHIKARQQFGGDGEDLATATLEDIDVEIRGFESGDGLTRTLHREIKATKASAVLYPGTRALLHLPPEATRLRYVYSQSADIVMPDVSDSATSVTADDWQDSLEENWPTKYDIGLQVIVDGKGVGILRYFGKRRSGAPWEASSAGDVNVDDGELCCGIELVKPTGTHNGTVDGVHYFKCKAGHGTLEPIHKVTVHGVKSRAREMQMFMTRSRQDARVRTSSRGATSANVSESRIKALMRSRREVGSSYRQPTSPLRNDSCGPDSDDAGGGAGGDGSADEAAAAGSGGGIANVSATAEAAAASATAAAPAAAAEPKNAVNLFMAHGGFIAVDKRGKCVAAFALARRDATPTEDAGEADRIELEFAPPRVVPAVPSPRVTTPFGHPLAVPGCERHFVLPETNGYSICQVFLHRSEDDDGGNNGGGGVAVCLMRFKLRQPSFNADEATTDAIEAARREVVAVDASGQVARSSAEVSVVLEQAPQLCAAFLKLFRFAGVDTTRLVIDTHKHKRVSAASPDDPLDKAVTVRASIEGKTLTVVTDGDGELVVRCEIDRRPQGADCTVREVNGRTMGSFDLLAIGTRFENERGPITPTTLQLWTSFNDWLDWRRCLQVNLAVFEESKYAIFRDIATFLGGDADVGRPPAKDVHLGAGAFGSVSKKEFGGIAYAVKTLDLCKASPGHPWDLVQAFLEAQVLLALRHPTLIPLESLAWRDSADSLQLYLTMEYCSGGDLKRYLYKDGPTESAASSPKPRLPPLVLLRVWREFFSGLTYLHGKHGLVHRDLKPDNVVVVRDLRRVSFADLRSRRDEGGAGTLVRIVDFGSACFSGLADGEQSDWATYRSSGRGTVGYQAPEMLADGNMYTTSVDVFSATCVVWECWARRRVFIHDHPGKRLWKLDNLVEHVRSGGVPDTAGFPPFLAAIVAWGCSTDPAKRPTAKEMFDFFYAQELAVDWTKEAKSGPALADAALKLASRRPDSVDEPVQLPFLFVDSISRLEASIDDFLSGSSSVLSAYLYIAVTAPTHLLPRQHLQGLMLMIRGMVHDKVQSPTTERVQLAWAFLGPRLIKLLRTRTSPRVLDAAAALLAVFAEVASPASHRHFLSHDCAQELFLEMRKVMKSPDVVSFFAKACFLNFLSTFVSAKGTPGFFQPPSANDDLMATVAATADELAELVSVGAKKGGRFRTTGPSSAASADGDGKGGGESGGKGAGASSKGGADAPTEPFVVLLEGGETGDDDAANDHDRSVCNFALRGVCRFCTCMASQGSIDVVLHFARDLDMFAPCVRAVRACRVDGSVYAEYDIVLHFARLACVWPCHDKNALMALAFLMSSVPFDIAPRPKVTSLLSSNLVDTGTRISEALFEAVLCQASMAPQGADFQRLMAVPLSAVWSSSHEDEPPSTRRSSMTEFQSVFWEYVVEGGPSPLSPSALWAFDTADKGAAVVATLLDEAMRGDVAACLRAKILWTAMAVVHDTCAQLEWRFKGHASSKALTRDQDVGDVPRRLLELLPTLVELRANDERPAMRGKGTAGELATNTLRRLCAPPTVLCLEGHDLASLLSYHVTEVVGLTETALGEPGADEERVGETVETAICAAYKALLLLVDAHTEAAVAALAGDAGFVAALGACLLSCRAKEEHLTKFGKAAAPYVLAFMPHEPVCNAVLQGHCNVFDVMSTMCQLADHGPRAGLYPPPDAIGVSGPESWFDDGFVLPMPGVANVAAVTRHIAVAAATDHFLSRSLVSTLVAAGSHNLPRGRMRPAASPSSFNLLTQLTALVTMLPEGSPQCSEAGRWTSEAVLELWSLTTHVFVPKESQLLLELLSTTVFEKFFLSPSATGHSFSWAHGARLAAVTALSTVLKRFWRAAFVMELPLVRLMGNWISELNSNLLLVSNAAQFLQSYTYMVVNPGEKTDDPKEEQGRRRKVKARQALPAQYPYRVYDLICDVAESNELVMLCVSDAHDSLLKIEDSAWPPVDKQPPHITFENEQRFAAQMVRIETNDPPIESLRVAGQVDDSAYSRLSDALAAHGRSGSPTLSHLSLFAGKGAEGTCPGLSANLCSLSSLSQVQLVGFAFRASKRKGGPRCIAMGLTLACVDCDRVRVELRRCNLTDRASAELRLELQQRAFKGDIAISPETTGDTLRGAVGNFGLFIDALTLEVINVKDSEFFAAFG